MKEIRRYCIQNSVVLAALLFSGGYMQPHSLMLALLGYVIVCLLSLLHVVLFDEDIQPHRPSIVTCMTYGVLGTGLLAASYLIDPAFMFFCLLFLILRFSHILWLHAIPVVNVAVLPIEMAVKGAAGAAIISAPLSGWGLICLFLLGLLISLGKTKNIMTYGPGTGDSELYTPKLLNEMMAVVSSSTIIAYCMYTISPETISHLGNDNLLMSVPFVVYGIFRYLWLINMVDLHAEVELFLFRDKAMGLNFAGWILTIVFVYSFSQGIT